MISIAAFNIFNELSEHINIKINSYREEFHDLAWRESKMHHDYDIWFILDGQVTIEINGLSCSAAAGDVVFFYPEIYYAAYMGPQGCKFIYIHFDYSIGNNLRILNDFNFSGLFPAASLKEETGIFQKGWLKSQKSAFPFFMFKGYFTVLISEIIDACYSESGKRYCFPRNTKHKCAGKTGCIGTSIQIHYRKQRKKNQN